MSDIEDGYSISKEWCGDAYPMFLVRTKADNRIIGKERFYDKALVIAREHNGKSTIESNPYASVIESLFRMADEYDIPVAELLRAAEPALDAVRPKPTAHNNIVYINTGLLF